MPITKSADGSIVASGPDGVRAAHLLTARRGLKLEIETGMVLSHKGSTVQALVRAGYVTEGTRSKRAAYRQIDALCVEMGMPSVALKPRTRS